MVPLTRHARWNLSWLLLAALTIGFVAYSPAVRHFRVVGPSMAPGFLGDHCLTDCPACGFRWASQIWPGTNRPELECPNCREHVVAPPMSMVPGDLVAVSEWDGRARRLRRWDVVVASFPDRSVLKRLVGLPGETIEIDQGDILVDGQRAAKTLRQFQNMALLVHDDRFRPSDPQRHRWLPGKDSGWTKYPHAYVYRGVLPPRSGPWNIPRELRECALIYRHLPYGGSVPSASVLDEDPFNPGTSRELNVVNDLMLEARLRASDHVEVILRLQGTSGRSELRILPDLRRADIVWHPLHPGDSLRMNSFFWEEPRDWHLWRIGLVDGRLLVGLDERQIAAMDIDPPGVANRSAVRSFSIAGQGPGTIRLAPPRILRDVHYVSATCPRRISSGAAGRIAGPYVLLGDNSPVSLDSRNEAVLGTVRADQLFRVIGRSPSSRLRTCPFADRPVLAAGRSVLDASPTAPREPPLP